MIIDDRMEEYRKMISHEVNPVLKRLYEVNLRLLQELKRPRRHQEPPRAFIDEKGEVL